MSNDPILDAMRAGGGGAAVAEQDDPILAAMRSGKKSRTRAAVDDLDFQPLPGPPRPTGVPKQSSVQGRRTASSGDDGLDFQPIGDDGLDFQPISNQSSPAQGISRTLPTISPRRPTMGERIKNVLTFGAPPGSVAGNLSGKVLQPGDEQREPQLITPEAAMTPTEQTQHPIATGLGELAGGLTTPQNVMLTVGSGGLGAMPGAAGRILPRLVSGVFSAQMLKGAYDQYPQFRAAVDRGDYSEAKRLATLMIGGAAMGAAAGRHALKGSPIPVEQTVPQEVAPSSEGTTATPAVPTTIGAGEQLHPERPETLQAQVGALQNGTNKAVYFPKGQENIPEPQENASVTVVKGNKPGAGTWYHSDEITPEQIRASVKDGSYAKLLGFTQTKEEAAANGKPTTVVARDVGGTELKAGIVDATNPQAVAEQAAEFTKQFPNSKVGVERPEDVIAKRQGITTKKANEGQEGPVSTETPQAGNAQREVMVRPQETSRATPTGENSALPEATLPSGLKADLEKQAGRPLTDEEAMIMDRANLERGMVTAETGETNTIREEYRTKLEQGTISEFAPQLRDFSDKLKEKDPELSAVTAQLANGDPSSFDGLRKYAQERMPDEQSKPLIAAIDAAARESKEASTQQVAGNGNELRTRESGRATEAANVTGRPTASGSEVSAEGSRGEESPISASHTEAVEPKDHILEAMRGTNGPRENFKTAALDRLIGKPVREQGKEATAGTVGQEAPEGTFNTGLNPVAAVKRIVPESVREKVGEEVESNRRARRLQGGLYDLDSMNAADMLRARDVLKEAPGTPKDQEAIYHHVENPHEPLTAEQRSILNGYLQPMLDESDRINEKLGGGEVENYVHRIPLGKGSRLERILGGESKLTGGSGLSKSASATKGRVMMALEDEEGERRVVAIKKGQVTAFDNGNAEHLGRIRGLETQGVKTKGELLAREIEPMQRELNKLEAERRTLTATKGREAASLRRIANIDDREAELRDTIQGAHRTDEGQLLSENDLRDRVFVDKNGKQWKITQATTREIEANTDQRYYKNALASSVMSFLNLRKAERAYDFLETYKSSPDFKEVAAKIRDGAAPAGWRTTDLPQFHGYVFEPHTAEVLDWYSKRMRSEGPNLYRQIGDFLRTAIFFNPLIHTPNIGVHWLVEKGLTGVGPQNWGRILRTGSKAIDAVIHQNQDFLDALDQGAPLQSPRLERDATTKLLIDRMGHELDANPTAAQKVAKALGYANPAKLVRAIYKFSGKATWVTNDIAMLQATYEHVERTGQSFKEAVTDVSKHIPDYRLPTRIFDSPGLAKLMSNPDLTMFGAYHYGALRSYGEMAKGLISDDVPQAERLKSLDRLAMLGLVTFVAYPQLDKLAKLLTGDKTAEFRRAGASTFVWNLAQLAKGDRTPTEILESVVTPAPHTKAAVELALNRNLYSGRKVYDTSASAGDIAKQVGRYAAQAVSPIQQASRVAGGRQTIPQFAAGLAGIRTKVKTPAERLASQLAMNRSPLGPGNDDQRQANALARSYEEKIRNGEIPTQELGKAIRRGELTEEQAVKIFRNSKTPPLERDFKQLPIEDALKVWGKASTDERKTLRPILGNKVWNLDLDNYAPARRQELVSRIRAALMGGVPRQPSALIPGMRIPVTPPVGAGARQ